MQRKLQSTVMLECRVVVVGSFVVLTAERPKKKQQQQQRSRRSWEQTQRKKRSLFTPYSLLFCTPCKFSNSLELMDNSNEKFFGRVSRNFRFAARQLHKEKYSDLLSECPEIIFEETLKMVDD